MEQRVAQSFATSRHSLSPMREVCNLTRTGHKAVIAVSAPRCFHGDEHDAKERMRRLGISPRARAVSGRRHRTRVADTHSNLERATTEILPIQKVIDHRSHLVRVKTMSIRSEPRSGIADLAGTCEQDLPVRAALPDLVEPLPQVPQEAPLPPSPGRRPRFVRQPSSFSSRQPEPPREADMDPDVRGAKGEMHNVHLSKLLTKLLRHGVPPGLPPDGEGWVPLGRACQHINEVAIVHGHHLLSKTYMEADVHAMVAQSNKPRFELRESDEGTQIRATYKHSVPLAASADESLTKSREHANMPPVARMEEMMLLVHTPRAHVPEPWEARVGLGKERQQRRSIMSSHNEEPDPVGPSTTWLGNRYFGIH